MLLVLERAPGANPVLWYADQTVHGGYGNLRDSDPTVASQVYEYREGSGQYPAASIPELVGRPYPLWNWCVAFRAELAADPAPVPMPAAMPQEDAPPAREPAPSLPAEAEPPPAATPAWQVLRGEADPPAAAPLPADPAPRGFADWVKGLFGRK